MRATGHRLDTPVLEPGGLKEDGMFWEKISKLIGLSDRAQEGERTVVSDLTGAWHFLPLSWE